MPQDLLQIALEHHRAGRLAQAAERYAQLLDEEARNADAMHWLGTLRVQEGKIDQAVELLERAAALRPDDAAFSHNLAQAYLQAQRFDEAVSAFERSCTTDPGNAQAWTGVAFALMSRRRPGDADLAVDALHRAAQLVEPTAESGDSMGVALIAAGQVDEAIEVLARVLAKHGAHAASYIHKAIAHRLKHEPREARKCLLKALEIDSGSARGWYELGTLDAEAGRPAVAAGLFRKAIAADRLFAAAYSGLALALDEQGDHAQAEQVRASLEHARNSPPEETGCESTYKATANDLHFALASRVPIFTPDRLPTEGVTKLFDGYAERFDDHLRGKLEYRVPDLIQGAVRTWLQDGTFSAGGKPDMLDLGCGTGQCGLLLRPDVRTLAGVDLAPAMIERARARGIYDRLDVGDLVERMRACAGGYDLLVAADVMIYVGDLSPAFEAAAACLRPGGRLIFSVESCLGDRYQLGMRTRRFSHSENYLRKITSIFGFELIAMDPVIIRQEYAQPVKGHLVAVGQPRER